MDMRAQRKVTCWVFTIFWSCKKPRDRGVQPVHCTNKELTAKKGTVTWLHHTNAKCDLSWKLNSGLLLSDRQSIYHVAPRAQKT